MTGSIITVWCLFSIANCFIVHRSIKDKKVENILKDSVLTPEYMRPLLYIAVVIFGPILFISKFATDMKRIIKK